MDETDDQQEEYGPEMSDAVEPILYDASSTPKAKVVLVHGALDRSMAFRGVVQRLYEYDVTVYDRRGYGVSVELTPASSFDDHVADLISVLEDAVVDEIPSVLIGHSYGGALAMMATVSRPDLVNALGVFEPPLPGVTLPTDDAPSSSASFPKDPEHLVRWMYRRVVGESAFERMDAQAQRALVAESHALRVDLESVRDAKPFDPTVISVPTIVGYGGESIPRHITRAEWLAEQIPNGTLFEAAGAAHACHRSHPEVFAQFVIEAASSQ